MSNGYTHDETPPPPPSEEEYRQAADWIADATHVLIGAGAGMSVDGGLDYFDKEFFAKYFPGMVKRGFQYPYALVGFKKWESPRLQWGYLSSFVMLTRFNLPPTKAYSDLLDLVRGKQHFVLTSNVDGMFELNSFDPERVYPTQGDFKWMQCLKPCSKAVWPSRPVLEKIAPHVNPQTQELPDAALVPSCPSCGGPVMMNVRGGDWFVEDHLQPHAQKLARFLQEARQPGNKLVMLEIGVGFNTPTVIRHRFEMIAYQHQQANIAGRLIRLNLYHPEVPDEIVERALPLQAKTGDALEKLKQLIDAAKNKAPAKS